MKGNCIVAISNDIVAVAMFTAKVFIYIEKLIPIIYSAEVSSLHRGYNPLND